MSVNKVGRPSKSSQRRQEILEAMADVVARDGLANTTIAKVAEAAQLQRTLVLHYFRDRDSLMAAFIGEAVASYGDQMVPSRAKGSTGTTGTKGTKGSTDTVADRVLRLFEPGAYRRTRDLVIWTELVALAARDSDVRRQLRDLWTRHWLPKAEAQLADAHPDADPDAIAATAYALAALVEAHWWFHLQGVSGPARRRQLQSAAKTLLGSL